jgi:hypothetical protein
MAAGNTKSVLHKIVLPLFPEITPPNLDIARGLVVLLD